jgi:hypothetical protein
VIVSPLQEEKFYYKVEAIVLPEVAGNERSERYCFAAYRILPNNVESRSKFRPILKRKRKRKKKIITGER